VDDMMQVVRRGRFGASSVKRDGGVAHIEDANTTTPHDTTILSPNNKEYPYVPESLSADALPFISKELVLKRGKNFKSDSEDQIIHGHEQQNSEYWIVIDNIVFDCSDFASEHPGGKEVILSFVGEDCSWQFWRLHGKSVMDQYGRALRIGRTEGIKNRFPETVRYVGLAKLGDDGW